MKEVSKVLPSFDNNYSSQLLDSIESLRFNPEHGFQISVDEIGDKKKKKLQSGFFSQKQIDNIVKEINGRGYLSAETGSYLKELFDGDYDIYIKTVHSNDLDSIFENGVYCNGSITSGFGQVPTKISDINLDNTVTKVDGMLDAIKVLKSANGYSQGMNPIDGTLILKIPKGVSMENIFISSNGVYAIDPKYIDGYFGVDKNGVVSDISRPKLNSGSVDVPFVDNDLNVKNNLDSELEIKRETKLEPEEVDVKASDVNNSSNNLKH